MDNRRWNRRKTTYASRSEEVINIEWKAVTMSEEEEDLIFRMHKLVGDRLSSLRDLIFRMHKLVGDRWPLIAGRIPGAYAGGD